MQQHQPRPGDVKNSEQRCSCHDVPLAYVDDEWVCSIDNAAREQLDEARRELLGEPADDKLWLCAAQISADARVRHLPEHGTELVRYGVAVARCGAWGSALRVDDRTPTRVCRRCAAAS